MGKQKTNKSAAARFKITKGGKVLHRSQLIRHLRSNKNKNQLRSLLTMKEVVGPMGKKIKRILGKA